MKTLSVDGNILSDDVTRTGVEKAIHHWERHGFGLWIFQDKKDGTFIGRGGLTTYQIEGTNLMGLAYAVLSDFWGRGLATEMAEASLQVGFDRLGFTEIFSWTLPINQRSQRVMEKLGFHYERDITFAGLPHRFYRIAKPWLGA
jgi:RimJ/RimL family protein N-acetyltransferase